MIIKQNPDETVCLSLEDIYTLNNELASMVIIPANFNSREAVETPVFNKLTIAIGLLAGKN